MTTGGPGPGTAGNPPSPSDWKAAGASDRAEKRTGLFAHGNKNADAAAAFDRWLLNPRKAFLRT